MTRTLLFFGLALGLSATAQADVRGPDDDLCTIEIQESDGSQCDECTVIYTAPETAHACDELAGRGWTVRCGVGGTVHRSVYCDRAEPLVRPGGAGCSIGRGGSALAPLLGLGAALSLRRARSRRSRRRSS